MRRALVCSCLICLLLAARIARSEIIGRGPFAGTYHVDRWQQHRFDFLYVHPKLHERLEKHAGQPIELGANKIHQVFTDGGAMIMDFQELRAQPTPVSVKLERMAPGGATTRPHRMTVDDTLLLWLTIENKTAAALDLRKCEIRLELSALVPDSPDRGRVLSQRDGFDWFFGTGLRDEDRKTLGRTTLQLYSADWPLRGVDETIDFAKYGHGSRRNASEAPILKAGESNSLSIKMEHLPPNEYEVAAVMQTRHEDAERKQKKLELYSSALRVDVLQSHPQPWHDVSVSLATAKGPDAGAPPGVPVTLTFTNSGSVNRFLYLPLHEGKIDFGNELLAFDAEGRQILRPVDGFQHERISLAPGKPQTFATVLPPKTRLARLAWCSGVGRLNDKGSKDEKPIPYGYLFSQHLIVDE